MTLSIVQSPNEPPKEPQPIPKYTWDDLLHLAPKTLLVFLSSGLLFVTGALSTQVWSFMSKDQQRLEAAINDAPSKYQARLSERVAIVETETSGLKRAVEANTAQTARLTVQVELLAAAIKGGR